MGSACLLGVLLHSCNHRLGNERRSLNTAWRKAWPVVKVDNLHLTFGVDNAVATINHHVQLLGCTLAYVLHLCFIEVESLRLAVDGFGAIFAMALVERIEPEEERRCSTTQASSHA